MQHDQLCSSRDLTWLWAEVKFWHRHFIVNMNIFRLISRRGTRWCPNCVTGSIRLRVNCENHFFFTKQSTIFTLLNLYSLTYWSKVNSGVPSRVVKVLLSTFSAVSILYWLWDIGTFQKKYGISLFLTVDDLCWPQCWLHVKKISIKNVVLSMFYLTLFTVNRYVK